MKYTLVEPHRPETMIQPSRSLASIDNRLVTPIP